MNRLSLVLLLVMLHSPARAQEVEASWYGEWHRGKPMANGKPFNPDRFTCAHRTLPLGTMVEVVYGAKKVVVKVTDRGPAEWTGRDIDLSRAAFAWLASPGRGHIRVKITPLSLE